MKNIGFGASGDRALIPLLKDLGFLSPDGTPTPRYHAYRDGSRSKAVMGEALKEAYTDVFHIRETPTLSDRAAVEGLFKSKLNSTDKVAQMQAMTFYALLKHADMKAASAKSPSSAVPPSIKREDPHVHEFPAEHGGSAGSASTGGAGNGRAARQHPVVRHKVPRSFKFVKALLQPRTLETHLPVPVGHIHFQPREFRRSRWFCHQRQ